jgi:hypothetical protein
VGQTPVDDVFLWKLRDVADAAAELPLEHQSERLQAAIAGLATVERGKTGDAKEDD